MSLILITGSHGFIGTYLREKLVSERISFLSLDNRLSLADPDYGDLLIPDSFREKVSQCTGIVHLGGCSRVIFGQMDPVACWNTNVHATQQLIQMALEKPKKPWLIYASSREVYGQQKALPVTEDMTLKPMNSYAHSKRAAEQLVTDAKKRGINTSIFRFSNVFGGSFDHSDRVIPAFCQAALLGAPLYLEGKDNVFDFTFISDVVAGIFKGICTHLAGPTDFEPIHFTTGRGLRLVEAARIILDIAKSASHIQEKPPRTYDVSYFYGDPSRAQSCLGWAPEHTFEQAITRYLPVLKEDLRKKAIILRSKSA